MQPQIFMLHRDVKVFFDTICFKILFEEIFLIERAKRLPGDSCFTMLPRIQ